MLGVSGLARFGSPELVDPAAGRLAAGLAALALGTLTFTSRVIRTRAIPLAYGVFALVSAWQIAAVALDGITPTTAFAMLLVFMGCSAGIQRTRTLSAFTFLFVGSTSAALLTGTPSAVPVAPFLSTLGALGARLGVFLTYNRNRTLARLNEARDQALAAARAKSEFLAAMSHEIRTPLNGVIGMTDVLSATPLTSDQRDSLATIQSSGRALLSVINDVLDFSKIEAGHLELESEPVDLRVVADDAAAVVASTAGERDIELVCRVGSQVPAVVLGDGPRLRQILLNLLSNAVKFTESGTVELDVSVENQRRSVADVVVHVTDTGIGIAPEHLETMFDSFTQGDASTTRRFGGTGLGLAITQRLTKAMGGEVLRPERAGRGLDVHGRDLPADRPARPGAGAR